jgi:hypothetical protein
MSYGSWDVWLVAEHELIERAMAVLRQNLERVSTPAFHLLQTARALDFLLEFGDKIHNLKEERHLFPLMIARGLPAEGGPIAVMLSEHHAERELLAAMQRRLSAWDTLGAGERRAFAQEGVAYLQVRAEHIWKENDVLYMMARRFLTPADAAGLLEAFAAVDRTHYGEDAAAGFARMLAEVEAGEQPQHLVERLSAAQLHGILETLPVEVTFVDAKDEVAFFNRLDKKKIFPRTRSVVGRKVEKCHPEHSVATVLKIVEGFRQRTLDKADFWIDFNGDKILIRYFPVFGDQDEYLGVLEVTQEIGWIQALKGQKRLLD